MLFIITFIYVIHNERTNLIGPKSKEKNKGPKTQRREKITQSSDSSPSKRTEN